MRQRITYVDKYGQMIGRDTVHLPIPVTLFSAKCHRDIVRSMTCPIARILQAQQLLDTWCTQRGDVRLRPASDGKATVAALAAREPLRPAPPVPFPATLVGPAHRLGAGTGVLPRQPLQRRA